MKEGSRKIFVHSNHSHIVRQVIIAYYKSVMQFNSFAILEIGGDLEIYLGLIEGEKG